MATMMTTNITTTKRIMKMTTMIMKSDDNDNDYRDYDDNEYHRDYDNDNDY
eukprot:CAMPEP_0194129782 /NCGR_PEP_ID=MMETSP0152-20130528/981_1 /TAXON_ID=1049557 /ORGANISM="Thalassiothrix antarctica, Strain L6-D1" /LENGTH=50 /DNA_ID=CAMNT_0038824115 /DNA_START=1135 /DNA_END=1288 /DNA_ORIENTATION=-